MPGDDAPIGRSRDRTCGGGNVPRGNGRGPGFLRGALLGGWERRFGLAPAHLGGQAARPTLVSIGTTAGPGARPTLVPIGTSAGPARGAAYPRSHRYGRRPLGRGLPPPLRARRPQAGHECSPSHTCAAACTISADHNGPLVPQARRAAKSRIATGAPSLPMAEGMLCDGEMKRLTLGGGLVEVAVSAGSHCARILVGVSLRKLAGDDLLLGRLGRGASRGRS